MDGKTQHGYLVLADISGYTSYVAQTELEHAQEVLSELLELVVDRWQPLLTLAKLEGDAVFAYAPETRLARGESLLELIEVTYFAFRDRVEGIRRRTTCDCNACRAIPGLDLKFIVHHGDYLVQSVRNISELVGSDVNLVHRLLKNHVTEATGWRAYALFTAAALEHLHVRPEPLHPQAEAYEHLGEVQTLSLDMRHRYAEMTETRRVFIDSAEADFVVSLDIPAPPPVVWDWLNDPEKRSRWFEGTSWTEGDRPGGRTRAGARNHCAHGKHNSTVETVLDWRPFDYFTVDLLRDNRLGVRMTQQLEALPNGHTRLSGFGLATQPPAPRLVRRLLMRGPARKLVAEPWQAMARLIAEAEPQAETAREL